MLRRCSLILLVLAVGAGAGLFAGSAGAETLPSVGGAVSSISSTVDDVTSNLTSTVDKVTSTADKVTSTVDNVASTVTQVANTTTTVSSPTGSSISVPSGGGTVTVPSGTATYSGGTVIRLASGETITVPPGGGPYTIPAGGAIVTVPAGGAITTAASLAPGFSPAGEQFFRLLGPPPPPASTANLLVPFPIVLIEGTYTRRGVRVRRLTVQAPPGARTSISCLGRRCPRGRLRQAVVASAGPMRAVRFRRFQRRFSAGVSISIYVTKPGKIGKYTRFKVRKGKPPTRADACVVGTARRPSACPT